MTRILIAEDEEPIREGLVDLLNGEGYETVSAPDGRSALKLFLAQGADLALLDIMMPGMSGYEVCREIRKKDTRVPVIFLSAREEEIDKVVGLEMGADDYVVKPFGVRELLARIKSVLRRSRPAEHNRERERPAESFPFAGGTVDSLTYRFAREGKEEELTEREVELLYRFARHPGEVLSRERLLEEVWGVAYAGTTRTLDQHIAKLRRKVERNPAKPRFITTVHGSGYRHVP